MKYSKYNIFYTEDNTVVCYNSFRNSFILLQQEQYKLIIDKKPYDIKKKELKLYNELINKGFILENEIDEYKLVYQRNRNAIIDDNKYQLTIIPTMDCNFKCWYCFEDHIKGSKMSINIQNSIVKHIENLILEKKISQLDVNWFGGEPLLHFKDIIYPLSLRLIQLTTLNNIKFTTSFVTNGSLLSIDNIVKFDKINVKRLQITLDGNKDKHNSIRYSKKGENSYDTILDNIVNINKYSSAYVNLRINYDKKTLNEINPFTDKLEDLETDKIMVSFNRVWQVPSFANEYELKNTAQASCIQKGAKIHNPEMHSKGYTCISDKLWQAVINFDGYVYKCTGKDFIKENSEGFLNENGIINWNKNILSKRINKPTFENSFCPNCKYLPICNVICSEAILMYDTDKTETEYKNLCPLNNKDNSFKDYIFDSIEEHINKSESIVN